MEGITVANTMAEWLAGLWKTGDFSDAVVYASDKQFRVHRVSNSYTSSMF